MVISDIDTDGLVDMKFMLTVHLLFMILIHSFHMATKQQQQQQQQQQQLQQQQQRQQQQKPQQQQQQYPLQRKHELRNQQQCNVLMHEDFSKCTISTKRHTTVNNKRVHRRCINNNDNNTLCARTFNVSYIRTMPYYNLRDDIITHMLSECCGACAHLATINTFAHASHLNISSVMFSDFVFPFLAAKSLERVHGFYFVPLIDTPPLYFITLKTMTPIETLMYLVTACALLWPFLVIVVLLAIVSGFVVWLTDTWANPDEFSRAFFAGLFDGFWWAIVSMTTVGYGDKCPTSFASRVASVLWILTGITMCAVFTGAITTEIFALMAPVTPEPGGKRIGWLKQSLYEATVIAQCGGKLVAVEEDDYILGVKKLFNLLVNGDVEGVILDKYAFNLFKWTVSDSGSETYDAALHALLTNQTILTEILPKTEDLSYGMLIKSSRDSAYFGTYLNDNRLQLKICNTFRLNINREEGEKDANIFKFSSGLFWPVFIGSMLVLAGITTFGLIWELIRRNIYKCYKKRRLRARDPTIPFTRYQKQWIDLYCEGDRVIGRPNYGYTMDSAGYMTRRELRKEMHRQHINLVYLEKCDVLIFTDSHV